MPTSPTPIAALPTPPSRDDSANFATRGDAFLAALPTFRSETNAVATNVYNNAVEVSSNASTVSSNTTLAVNSANAAAGSAGASIWVSGTTYALGAVVWSPANGQIYRRIVGGAGTTDPSADSTNWTNVMPFVFSGGNSGFGTTTPNRSAFDSNARVLTIYGNNRGFLELGSATPINSDTLGGLEFLSSTTKKGFIRCVLDGSANGSLQFAANGSTAQMTLDALGSLLVGGTSTSTIPVLNRGVYLQSTTNNDVIGYSLHIPEGSNSRRGSMFLDDANGIFGWDVTASSGVPAYAWRSAGRTDMVLDATGNLSVGTTTNRGRITTSGSGDQTIYFTHSDNNPGRTVTLRLGNNDATYHTSSAFIRATQGIGIDYYDLSFGTSFSGAAQTRMTLDGAGNFGVGTTSPSAFGLLAVVKDQTADTAIVVGNGGTSNAATTMSFALSESGSKQGWLRRYRDGTANTEIGFSDALLFTGNVAATKAERGRFTAGGYFKASNAGTYLGSTESYHEFRSDITVANGVLFAHATSGSATSDGIIQSRASRNTTNNTFYFFSCYNDAATAYKFRIADSGNATNTNNSYGAISDEKMKQDVIDAASQWDDIKGLRVRKFRYKADPTGPMQIGLVAQEAETISPGLVEEHTDRDAQGNDLGTTTKAVKYSILYMKAIKALQEAMARIESLEAKVNALEAA